MSLRESPVRLWESPVWLTAEPSQVPSVQPSQVPSEEPSQVPSVEPSQVPSVPNRAGSRTRHLVGGIQTLLHVPFGFPLGVLTAPHFQFLFELRGSRQINRNGARGSFHVPVSLATPLRHCGWPPYHMLAQKRIRPYSALGREFGCSSKRHVELGGLIEQVVRILDRKSQVLEVSAVAAVDRLHREHQPGARTIACRCGPTKRHRSPSRS